MANLRPANQSAAAQGGRLQHCPVHDRGGGVSTAPITKEAQRAELHRTIWRIANDLRGSVDGWDFKSYVLGILFYRFISENLTTYLNEQERKAGDADFDYPRLSHKEAEFGRTETVAEKGFFILPGDLFVNVRARAKSDANLNETLERVFRNIEGSALGTDSEDDLKGLFDDLDVNSAKLGPTVAKRNEKLVKLLEAIGDLNLGDFGDHAIDSFGDAYEYLMQMYAANAGKSGGEYYTPQEVSELLARITVVGKKSVNKVYDPACGSGSLLLKFARVLGKDNVRKGFFGQEINLTTYNLARINMFLHDINFEQFNIAHGDTLLDPAHWDDEPFEAIVSNPPYSIRWPGDENPLLISDSRYSPAGVLAPKAKADLAFTMHMLSWLAVNGTAAIVEFPGVLYRGGAEQKIRKYLIDNNYIDTVIQLPADLFFGTTIQTCILVLKKSKKDNKVLFIDASCEFTHVGNKNKLLPMNQQRILDAFTGREHIKHFAMLVPNADLAENDYNISVSSYVEQEDTREAVDIGKLNADIAEIVARQSKLRTAIDAIVHDLEEDGSAVV
jgi:type I restriction enzyme M protein